MAVLPLNKDLLSVILAVQARKNFEIAMTSVDEAEGKTARDWLKNVECFFMDEMELQLMGSLGLTKNRYCFEALLNYPVTQEIMSTEFESLNQFTFAY